MFISERKKLAEHEDEKEIHAQTFLGSHNLTLSGLTQNLELCFSSNDTVLFENCINYVNSLLKNHYSEHPACKKIEQYVDGKATEQRLLHNEKEAILDQCLRSISSLSNTIEEVIIFSPYFSNQPEKLVEIINDKVKPNKIKLCIQRKNHNLDPTTVRSFKKLSLYEVRALNSNFPKPFQSNERRLHSKFIVFRSFDKDLILIGSPNFTKPALLETSKDGNFESAMLFELSSNDLIDNYLKIEPINEKEIIDSQRDQINRNPQPSHSIVITNAYFDDSDVLHVYYSNSKTKKTGRLVGECQNTKDQIQNKISPSELIELKEGLKSISISSMPREITEVHFTENDQTVSNLHHVFEPTALRVRTRMDLTDTSTIKKTLDDIEDNVIHLLDSFFYTSVKRIDNTKEKKNSEFIPLLGGKITSVKSSSSLYNYILKGIKLRHSKTKTASSPGQEPSSKKNVVQPEENELINKVMPKFYSLFMKAVITHPECSIRYEVFLMIFLKIFSPQFEQGKELGIESARIITQLNEIIKEDQSFSKLSNIDRMKIFLLLEVLTKQYHKNLEERYIFDTSNAEILCAFKPVIAPNSETYRVEHRLFDQLEKHSNFMNKINSQAQFDVDEQELDIFKADLKKLSDSI
jgi:hypothetical protein